MRSPRLPGFSPAYVESVASFYDRLYLQPTGTPRGERLCDPLVPAARGGRGLGAPVRSRRGLRITAAPPRTARITIQEAQCLGYCDHAPCIQVDAEQTIGPMTPESAAWIVDELRGAPAPREFWR